MGASALLRVGGFTASMILAMGLAGCTDVQTVRRDPLRDDPVLRLEGSTSSLEELGRRVLTALQAGDVAGLDGLRLTEYEHNELVWPELPASAPGVNFPVDFAWTNIQSRNRAALRRITPILEGEQLIYQATECRGEPEAFKTFRVLTDCWVIFAPQGFAAPYQARLFKDVLVRGGGHKVFRYYDEEPRRYRAAGDAERVSLSLPR